jgi:hypothetical protein
VADGLAGAHVRGQQGQQQNEGSSARERPPTREEISAAVKTLRNKDAGTLRQVEPLARRLTVDLFEEAMETLRARCLANTVRNDAGYLMHLLRVTCQELRDEHEAAFWQGVAERQPPETKVGSRIEQLKREDPAEYKRKMAAFRESIGRKVA